MSKDKPSKKDKLKKYDLFSIMLEQSSVFRSMVERFQGVFGLGHQPEQAVVVAAPVVTSSKPRKGVKTNKRARTVAGAKSSAAKKLPSKVVKASAVETSSVKPAAVAKKVPAKTVPVPAKKASTKDTPKAVTKKPVAKTAKKRAPAKVAATKK